MFGFLEVYPLKRTLTLFALFAIASSLIFLPLTAQARINTSPDAGSDYFYLPLAIEGVAADQSITGRITDEFSNPIGNVVVTDGNGHDAVTDSDGNYTITGLIQGTYTILPSNGNFSFWPDSRTLEIPPASAGQNFFATAMAGCTERLYNGGFEDDSDWEFPLTVYPADYSTNHVLDGTRSVRTGIEDSADNIYSYSSTRQAAIIPSGSKSVTLAFWFRPMTSEPADKALPEIPTGPKFGNEVLAYDAQYVLVLDKNNNLLETLVWQRTQTIGYEYRTVNLRKYAGQTIKIEFGSYNDGYEGITRMYIDDVSLIACDTTTPTTTPTAGSSPTTTSTPTDCENVIDNSSFESDDGWYIPVTEYPADYSSARSYTGDRSMRTGITNINDNTYSFSDAGQAIKIPANATQATLGLWIYPQSSSPGVLAIPEQPLGKSLRSATLSGDLQYVLVLDKYDNWIDTLIWQRSDSRRWEYDEFNLRKYRGQTIKIQFGTYNDGWGGVTSMFVDDVVMTFCSTPVSTATITPTPTVTRTPTPTHTPGPTQTPSSTAVCRNELNNSSFEATRDWNIPLTEYSADYSTDRAHIGDRSMRTGILKLADNRYSYSDAEQLVTIPGDAGSATLRIWLYPISGEATEVSAPPIPDLATFRFGKEALASDVQYILILDQYGNWIDTLFWQKRDDSSWLYFHFNLRAYAGDTIYIHFGTYNDGYGGITAMYVDDAELEVCR